MTNTKYNKLLRRFWTKAGSIHELISGTKMVIKTLQNWGFKWMNGWMDEWLVDVFRKNLIFLCYHSNRWNRKPAFKHWASPTENRSMSLSDKDPSGPLWLLNIDVCSAMNETNIRHFPIKKLAMNLCCLSFFALTLHMHNEEHNVSNAMRWSIKKNSSFETHNSWDML